MTSQPDAGGHYGPYGGRFVPEVLMAPLEEIEQVYAEVRNDPAFQTELRELLENYAGRPTPLWEAKRLSEMLGGARIFLKREDLLHTGAHKINNCLGQALLARKMGKRRVVAETGAGQHGVATATVCALFGMNCVVYMGEEDMRRQQLNVFRMRLLGAKVVGVSSGSRTLKDAISEAMRDWVTNVETTYYLFGSALGAHPYPQIVRDFQSVIGRETKAAVSGRRGAAARRRVRLRGRRQQRHRHLSRVHSGCPGEAGWSGSRRPQPGTGAARGPLRRRKAGSAARGLQLPPAGRRWPSAADALGFGGAGLRFDRAGTRLAS